MTAHMVSLRRVSPRCSSCGGPRMVRTAPTGTEVSGEHAAFCRIARALVFAGQHQARVELLPTDDRHIVRRSR